MVYPPRPTDRTSPQAPFASSVTPFSDLDASVDAGRDAGTEEVLSTLASDGGTETPLATSPAARPSPGDKHKAFLDRALDDPWLVHKTVKQAFWRPIYGSAFLPRVVSLYRTYAARYGQNPNEDIFQGDRFSQLYDSKRWAGRNLRNTLTPRKFHQESLTPDDFDALRASAAPWGRAMATLYQSANYARIAGNIPALISLYKNEHPDLKQSTVIVSDTLLTGTFLGVQQFYKVGYKNIELGRKAKAAANAAEQLGNELEAAQHMSRAKNHQFLAYKAFDRGKNLSFISFAVQMAQGLIKVGVETDRLLHHPEQARLSALMDGAVDAGQGAAYAAYNWFLVRQGQLAAKGGSIENIKKATDVLSSSAQVIPTRLLWTMRVAGVVGCVMGAIPNAISLYDGCTSDELSERARRHKIISGVLGLGSSIAFLGGALAITPASMPFGAAMILVGNALLVTQTVYDEWDNWFGTQEFAQARADMLPEDIFTYSQPREDNFSIHEMHEAKPHDPTLGESLIAIHSMHA